MVVDVVIPALNEEASVGKVLDALQDDSVRNVYVIDNGSTDQTAAIARRHGAICLAEPKRGYGAACLRGIAALRKSPPEVVVFLDADFSDDPTELGEVLAPIASGEAEFVVGSRVLGRAERGALLPQARFGNWLSTRLIEHIFGVAFTDLGPFRAIRWDALERLDMIDQNFGWTVEMQVRAARAGVVSVEVPVSYRRRIGQSKVSGTVSGSVRAGIKILAVIGREAAAHGVDAMRAAANRGH